MTKGTGRKPGLEKHLSGVLMRFFQARNQHPSLQRKRHLFQAVKSGYRSIPLGACFASLKSKSHHGNPLRGLAEIAAVLCQW